jgi:hypothetical protein
MGNSGFILWEKNPGLRSAGWEVGSFGTLWLPVKECNIIAESVRIMLPARVRGQNVEFGYRITFPGTECIPDFCLHNKIHFILGGGGGRIMMV